MPTETIETTVVSTEGEQLCTCSNCGCEYVSENGICFDDQELCPDCAEELTVICVSCGERLWNEQNVGDSDTPLCQHCYDNHYTSCEQCGAIIHVNDAYRIDDDDDYDYCYNCYCHRQSERRVIHDYSYKPDPIFYPTYDQKILYLGVELEIDEGGKDTENAEELLRIANSSDEHIYCKFDSSITNGFELVSHPASIIYHKSNIPWENICEKAVQLHYFSHLAPSAGLHVHVSRAALGETEQEQEDTIARILYFVEAHFNEMLRFSRRTEAQLNKWAARYGYRDHPKEMLDHAKNSNLGRYTAVNITNSSTLEFRLYRGTLKYSSFIAALEMTRVICIAAITMSDDEFRAMSWADFVLSINKDENPELIEYLKIRRLYVNEEMPTEEEI